MTKIDRETQDKLAIQAFMNIVNIGLQSHNLNDIPNIEKRDDYTYTMSFDDRRMVITLKVEDV